jgi:hypothetical protein
MKIELDFSSPVELRKTRRELEMALAAIDSALNALGVDAAKALESTIPDKPRQSPTSVIDALPPSFTTREARKAAEAAGVSDQRIRNEIARQIDKGTLRLAEAGKGTIPSTFAKVKRSMLPTRDDVADQL